MTPAFDIPSLIPPLPPSSIGKENDKKSLIKNQYHTPFTRNVRVSQYEVKQAEHDLSELQSHGPNGEYSSPITRSLNDGKAASQQRSQPKPLSRGTDETTGKRRSVLRFGESMESLFCLKNTSPKEHWKLSHKIVNGELSEDPFVWGKVLQLASKTKLSSTADLIRLHRRATLRFPLDTTRDNDTWRCREVLKIWTAFASLQARFGMVDEARRTYRYIENQKKTIEGPFLGPTQEDPLSGLMGSENINSSFDLNNKSHQGELPEYPGSTLTSTLNTTSDRLDGEMRINSSCFESSASPTEPKCDYLKSPKRQRTENGYLSCQAVREQSQSSRAENTRRRPLSSSANGTCGEGGAKGGIRARHEGAKIVNRSKPTPSSSGKVRSNRVGRFSARLSRKGLSGRAKRIEQESSILEDSDTESEDQCNITAIEGRRSIDKHTRVDPHKCAPPKIKKMDLSYMWEWDPNARTRSNSMKRAPLPMNEGSSADGQATGRSHSTNKSIDSETSNVSVHSISNHAKRTNTESKEVSKDKDSRKHDKGRDSISKREELLSKAAFEFLPLVHENNILRVNNTSYAKLGVIGKGGSCKVYRALSKQCSVVAIKKVKLEGMDKKAIEGYANEISLLQRLRGNPAIIQMYDSEVDLERKSIFVVMELGEADLNHVLQQRALSGSCRSLSMNFIRLTWQQMLSAVHCIHEERIIHSDLKPANFLFVRGALKLIDFGIAKAIQNDDTTNIYRESHIGTLNYMSPEAILDTETGSDGLFDL